MLNVALRLLVALFVTVVAVWLMRIAGFPGLLVGCAGLLIFFAVWLGSERTP